MKLVVCAIAVAVLSPALASGARADWDPARFTEESTLELLTIDAEKGEHWFPVWLVVLSDEVYIRLGSRAADHIEGNTRAPIISVRIAGEEFESVRAEAAPDMTVRVAEAMGEKYLTDILIRFFPHPLTMRLVPAIREARPATASRNSSG